MGGISTKFGRMASMTAAIPVLKLQQIEPPPELAEALAPAFTGRLGIKNPPPVRLVENRSHIPWGGWCEPEGFAEFQEVTVVDYSGPPSQERLVNRLRDIYMHETAHFLLRKWKNKEIGGAHGPVFFSLNLLLFLRAGEKKEGWPWWQNMSFYDIQDFDFFTKNGKPIHSIGQAVDWAWDQAHDLARYRRLSAEDCSIILQKRYKKWIDDINLHRPKRRNEIARMKWEARARRQQRRRNLLDNYRKLKKKIWYVGLAGVVAGWAMTLILFIKFGG